MNNSRLTPCPPPSWPLSVCYINAVMTFIHLVILPILTLMFEVHNPSLDRTTFAF